MKILNLVENTSNGNGCACEHGLSFYVETKKHRLLVDTGATDVFLENAKKLSVDITSVDTVVLSHGHYDHGGGIMAFLRENPGAKLYIRENAFDAFYHGTKNGTRYIGIDPQIARMPQVVRVAGNMTIGGELLLFTNVKGHRLWPSGNAELLRKPAAGETVSRGQSMAFRKTDGVSALVPDDFSHEQYLVLSEGGRRVLMSGCAHNGILNILEEYGRLYGGWPDVVISGFHMMKKHGYTDEDITVIRETARELAKLPVSFFTCHCTGEEPFMLMKEIMGAQLTYVHSGERVDI